MKIPKNKNTTIYKILLLLVILAAVVIGALFATGYFDRSEEKDTTTQPNSSNTKEEDGDNDKDTGEINDSVSVPPAPDVSKEAPFPIENSHYTIRQDSSTAYTITLNAIINSPSQYDEYRAQLKQYKQEALDYLKGRFGDISKFVIDWNPDEAQNL